LELSLASQTPQLHIFFGAAHLYGVGGALVHFEAGVWSTSFVAPNQSNMDVDIDLYIIYPPMPSITQEKMFRLFPENPILLTPLARTPSPASSAPSRRSSLCAPPGRVLPSLSSARMQHTPSARRPCRQYSCMHRLGVRQSPAVCLCHAWA
jgi:hypothetical protein